MKKLISLTLTLIMILSSLFALAQEKEQNFSFDVNETGNYFNTAFDYKGKIYLMANQLYEVDIDNKRVNALGDIKMSLGEGLYFDTLFSDGENMYGVNPYDKKILSVSLDGTEFNIKLLHEIDTDLDFNWGALGNTFFYEGIIYMLFENQRASDREQRALIMYDTKTGEEKTSQLTDIAAAAPYKDGKLLLAQFSPNQERYSEPVKMLVSEYDPKTDSIGANIIPEFEIENYPRPSFLYHNDEIYVIKSPRVYKLEKDGTLVHTASLPSSQHGLRNLINLGDGRFAFFIYDNSLRVAVRNFDPSKLPTRTLKIAGADDYNTSKASIKLQDITVENIAFNVWGAVEMGQYIINADDSYDIIQVSTSYADIDNLIKKGYVAEIDSPKISEFVNSMADAYKNLVIKDGKVYGIVAQSYMNGFAYDEEAFKKLGIEVPTSYLDLLKKQYEFEKSESEDKGSYKFSESYGEFKNMWQALAMYIQSKAAKGEELLFNTPEFKELIKQVKNNLLNTSNEEPNWSDNEEMNEFFEKPSLIRSLYSISPSTFMYEINSFKSLKPLKIGLFDGDEPFIMANPSLFLINPRSKNIDIAIRFIETYIEEMNLNEKAVLQMHLNAPIEHKNYEDSLNRFLSYVEDIKKTAESMSGAEKENFMLENSQVFANFDESIDSIRYEISQKAVDAFNEYVKQNMIVADYNMSKFIGDEAISYDFADRYIKNQMDEDMLVNELDNKVKLIRLEQE